MNNFWTKEATIIDIEQLSIFFNEYRIFYKKESDIVGAKQFLFERMKNIESEIFVVVSNAQTIVGIVQL